MNRPEMVSPGTRERVLRIMEELGYTPNAAARSLLSGRTNTIALVLPDIRNPFFTNVARGVEDAAQRYGYTLTLGNSDERPEKERRYLDALSSRRVDGVILATSGDGDDHVRLLQQRGFPVVLFDRAVPGVAADIVLADVYDGGRKIIAHLLERGYREITFIGGPQGVSTLEARLAGCRDAMREAGLSLSVRPGRFDQESGDEIVTALHAEQRLPGALVAANNLVAVGAVAALRRCGLRIPEDVGIACFGELALASALDPFLTVVRDPEYDAGRQLTEMLHERISGYAGPPRRLVLPVELVARRSTAVCRRWS
jgi:DNA-binding LacI/PurR family transcriptional regulator